MKIPIDTYLKTKFLAYTFLNKRSVEFNAPLSLKVAVEIWGHHYNPL